MKRYKMPSKKTKFETIEKDLIGRRVYDEDNQIRTIVSLSITDKGVVAVLNKLENDRFPFLDDTIRLDEIYFA